MTLSEIQPTNTVKIYSGNLPMIIPTGGGHVRQVEILLPGLSAPPAVTASIFTNDASGTVFGIYHIAVNRNPGRTQIVISATNVQAGVAVPYPFWCSFIIAGVPE